jgi:hypothetical protein
MVAEADHKGNNHYHSYKFELVYTEDEGQTLVLRGMIFIFFYSLIKKKKKRKLLKTHLPFSSPHFQKTFIPKFQNPLKNLPHLHRPRPPKFAAHCSSPATALCRPPALAISQIFPSPPYISSVQQTDRRPPNGPPTERLPPRPPAHRPTPSLSQLSLSLLDPADRDPADRALWISIFPLPLPNAAHRRPRRPNLLAPVIMPTQPPATSDMVLVLLIVFWVEDFCSFVYGSFFLYYSLIFFPFLLVSLINMLKTVAWCCSY